MKRTGSGVLALTAALTASSILRESMYLSRYSCTDIFSEFSRSLRIDALRKHDRAGSFVARPDLQVRPPLFLIFTSPCLEMSRVGSGRVIRTGQGPSESPETWIRLLGPT